MRLSSILLVHAGLAAGFVAARQLLATDDAKLDELPEGVRGPLKAARSRLERVRARAVEGLAEGAREADAAQAALMLEYRQRAGRPDSV
jgi:hypothetical protein